MPSRLSVVRPDEPVREQVQAQVGVVGVGRAADWRSSSTVTTATVADPAPRVLVLQRADGRCPAIPSARPESRVGVAARRAPGPPRGHGHASRSAPGLARSAGQRSARRGRPGRPSRSGRRAATRRRRPRARRRRARTVTGESPPRSTWATAAPLAPVPEDSVSPTPRSKIRARIAAGRDLGPERDVGAVRERVVVLDRRAELGEVERLELLAVGDADRALRVADRDVLEAHPATRRRPSAARPGSPHAARAAHVDAAGALGR